MNVTSEVGGAIATECVGNGVNAKLLEIGMIPPPIGLNVFVLKGVMGDRVSTGTIFAGVTYFILADIAIIALLVAFPGIILFTKFVLP